MNYIKKLILIGLLCMQSLAAHAAIDAELLKPLGGDDPDARIEAVNKIAALATDDALKVLHALKNDALYVDPQGQVVIIDNDQAYDPATGKNVPTPDGVDGVTVNNLSPGLIVTERKRWRREDASSFFKECTIRYSEDGGTIWTCILNTPFTISFIRQTLSAGYYNMPALL